MITERGTPIAYVVKCPVCDGAGLVSRPPWLPGDAREWSSSHTAPYECHACEGGGYIMVHDRAASAPSEHGREDTSK